MDMVLGLCRICRERGHVFNLGLRPGVCGHRDCRGKEITWLAQVREKARAADAGQLARRK